jgi:hypothetical protein
MPRTTLTPQNAPGAYAGALLLTMTAADVANMNQFKLGGRDVMVVHNSGASGRTFTITSVDDRAGRQEHITAQAIAAGEIFVFGPIDMEGWRQTDGNLYFDANHAEVKIGIIRIP